MNPDFGSTNGMFVYSVDKNYLYSKIFKTSTACYTFMLIINYFLISVYNF